MFKSWAALAAIALLVFPAGAQGHAQLLETEPPRGAQLERSPARALFRFNEPVELGFGSLRVFDAAGEEVQSGTAEHPAGSADAISVALPSGLADGGYTATYRVVSADGHPVSGGFVFTVGEGGPMPRVGVAELIEAGQAGPLTEVAFGAVRALAYLAIALALGGLAFALIVWRPALRVLAETRELALGAAAAFARRSGLLLAAAAVLGVLTSALGIALQGATAAGVSFWEALDPSVLEEVFATRFGTVWALRLAAWVAIGAPLAVPALRAWLLGPRDGIGDAPHSAPGPRAAPLGVAALVALVGFVAATPALSGHAGTQDPVLVLAPADYAHVLAMGVWVGGLIALVAALPAATRRLPIPDRTRLLAATVTRFSPLALASVVVLAATGALAAIVHLSALSELWESAFGRAVAIKVVLLAALVALGAHNRQRSRPRLVRAARAGEAPGAAGASLRRVLLTEVALLAAVLGVSAALVSYPPPSTATTGPYSTSADLGPARLELTVDPARVGPNEIHLYLFDARSGAQFDRAEEVEVGLTLPEHDIGPLVLSVEKAGPGHFLAPRAEFVPGGDWELSVRARVSEFEEHRAELEVPVR